MRHALLICLLLAGCASTGVQVKEDQLKNFERGKSTIADVTQRLGEPTTTMLQPDGSRLLIYTYAHAQTRASTFIPVVGIFAGGADAKTNTAMFRFNKNGILIDYSASESNYGTGTGFAAGTPIKQVDQPRQLRVQ